MGASDELEYLKSLVSQLNDKITALEKRAKPVTPKSPVRQLRTVLIGPPGAGTPFLFWILGCWYNSENRKGNTGSKVARRVLRMPLGNWRYVTRAGGEEDTAGNGGKEDHGRRRASFRRCCRWHD